MFTGLVEEIGTIVGADERGGAVHLTVRGGLVIEGLAVDDSVAIDGCCQTVVGLGDGCFTVVAVEDGKRAAQAIHRYLAS